MYISLVATAQTRYARLVQFPHGTIEILFKKRDSIEEHHEQICITGGREGGPITGPEGAARYPLLINSWPIAFVFDFR